MDTNKPDALQKRHSIEVLEHSTVLIVCSKDSSKEVQKDLLETYSEIVSNCVKVVVFRLKTKSRNEFQLFYNGRDRAKSGLYLLWKTCSVSIYFILDLLKPWPGCRGIETNDISINRRETLSHL